MELQFIASYLMIGMLVSLFIDLVSWVSGGLGVTNWHRVAWILFWPAVIFYLWMYDNE
jgi:hypothetical protein